MEEKRQKTSGKSDDRLSKRAKPDAAACDTGKSDARQKTPVPSLDPAAGREAAATAVDSDRGLLRDGIRVPEGGGALAASGQASVQEPPFVGTAGVAPGTAGEGAVVNINGTAEDQSNCHPLLGPGFPPVTGAYAQRELAMKQKELSGELKFKCVTNDGVVEHMILLVSLKNIFSKQLPNMPKEYIIRLVMDRNHHSMVGIKNGQVVGGITYRPYHRLGFAEIAFCAVTVTEQVKGNGTRLMNHLKEYARTTEKVDFFLTYADNNAVGYFSKQGFTKELTLEKDTWSGYIKDYEGGTLMECKVDPRIPYTGIAEMIAAQRKVLDEKLREVSKSHITYPGLGMFKSKGQGLAVQVKDIPGLKEAGWESAEHYRDQNAYGIVTPGGILPPTPQNLHAYLVGVHKAVCDHADAWPFREPVSAVDVPDYYDIIKDPIGERPMYPYPEGVIQEPTGTVQLNIPY
eukprot:jgi/Mesvir1/1045/Mv25111-RA.1